MLNVQWFVTLYYQVRKWVPDLKQCREQCQCSNKSLFSRDISHPNLLSCVRLIFWHGVKDTDIPIKVRQVLKYHLDLHYTKGALIFWTWESTMVWNIKYLVHKSCNSIPWIFTRIHKCRIQDLRHADGLQCTRYKHSIKHTRMRWVVWDHWSPAIPSLHTE